MNGYIRDFVTAMRNHNHLMNNSISLIASENVMSSHVKEALISDLGNRVAEGWLGERIFPGLTYYDYIEELGMRLIKEALNASFVDLRPISGTHANMVLYTAFTQPKDIIISYPIKNGAHISMSGATPRKMFSLNVEEFSIKEDGFTIDVEKSIDKIKKSHPKLVIFGGSVILQPQNIDEIIYFCQQNSIITVYDASHVIGLILGDCYYNPLDKGVDLMTFSTCKTIPGPQHAMIVTRRDDLGEIIKKTTFPATVSGHHLHETVAAIIAFDEMMQFGKEYSKQIVSNARELGKQLILAGFEPYCIGKELTSTHMLLIKNHLNMPIDDVVKKLEQANIMVNKNMLPCNTSYKDCSGLRLGTPEVTRLGMKEPEMKEIATFIQRVLLYGDRTESVKKDVIDFRSKFQTIHYSYEF